LNTSATGTCSAGARQKLLTKPVRRVARMSREDRGGGGRWFPVRQQ
jgi:hypothetical protein